MLSSAGNSSSFLSLEISAPDIWPSGDRTGPKEQMTSRRNRIDLWDCDSSTWYWVTRINLESKGSCWGEQWRCFYNLLTWNHKALWWWFVTGCPPGAKAPIGVALWSWAGQPEAAPGGLERWSLSLKCLCAPRLLVRQQTFPTIKIKLLFWVHNPRYNIICI